MSDLEDTEELLSPDLRGRLYELFHLLRDMHPDERETRIRAECQGLPDFEEELRGMLTIDETLPPGFLESALAARLGD